LRYAETTDAEIRRFSMSKHMRLAAVGALFVGIAVASTSAWIGSPNRTTYVTFNQAVALPDVQLTAGTYIFEVANPETTADVVRVSSRDRSKVHFMGHTHMIERPSRLSNEDVVMLGEAARGTAPPITAWFAVGAGDGRQFIYK
jgi:hypothetical protein